MVVAAVGLDEMFAKSERSSSAKSVAKEHYPICAPNPGAAAPRLIEHTPAKDFERDIKNHKKQFG